MVSAGRSRWRKVTHRTSVQGSPVSYSAERREPGKTIWRPQSEITCWLVVALLVVTIPDLMLRVRECYDDGQSEASLLDDLCQVDLLILDEVGIQRGSSGEKVILNQVIDRRLSSMRRSAS